MSERIKDKIEEVEKFVSQLEEFAPSSFEDYIADDKTRAACERTAEKIIEGLVDLAFLVIKSKGFKMPEDDESSFDMLLAEKIINERLFVSLKKAKGMRNILAHEYGKIDDEIVFDAISNELVNDAKEFIKEIKKS